MLRRSHWKETIVFSFANGAAGAGLIQSKLIPACGEVLNIHQINTDPTTPRTAKLTIENASGNELWDGTAKNSNSVFDHEFGVTIRRIVTGSEMLKCVCAGDPGASGYTVTAIVSMFGGG